MGKIYYSPYASYIYIVRPRRDIFEGGVKVDEVRELLAEFAVHRGEYVYLDKDGNQQVAADIQGHYFDLNSYADQHGWTQEERDLCEKRLDLACINFPDQISHHSQPAAPKPWAKYDETVWGQIAKLAEAFGCVPEALAYERENENRKGVIDALEALIETPDEAVEELAAL